MRTIFVSLVFAAIAFAASTGAPQPHVSPVATPEQQAAVDAKWAAYVAAQNGPASGIKERSVTCEETFLGLANFNDAVAAAENVRALGSGTGCGVTNSGAGCTLMATHGSAGAWICGNQGATGDCLDAGNGLLDVANTCEDPEEQITAGVADFAQANMASTTLIIGSA
ncbi:hypothetical protein C8F01DRAFT_1130880 [Mycena amicta]|nr:hypothetical protein C8F01DRAFT_1130880 [Mycena amicta]